MNFFFILSEISREFQTRYQCYHGIREIQRAGKTAGTKQISGKVHHLLMIVFFPVTVSSSIVNKTVNILHLAMYSF